ncbi:MAG: HD domain-containing protein [Clostridia bacterium]|nr:HD domain-containing protein [Clostridia bacterium]
MIYTEKTKKAMQICFQAHKEQTDKSGVPYVFHPFHVAECMKDEDSTVTALLHDVVEDTDWTFEGLQAEGFGENVMEALRLLTHKDGIFSEEAYLQYVTALKENPIARAVKIADLEHNSDLTRFGTDITERDIMRAAKYQKALILLK